MKHSKSCYLLLRRSRISLKNWSSFVLFLNGVFSCNDITFHFSLFRHTKTCRLVLSISYIDSANNSCSSEFWICNKHLFMNTPLTRIDSVVKSLYLSYHFSTNI